MNRNMRPARFNAYIAISVLMPTALTAVTARAQQVVYVDDDALPGGDGGSWSTAFVYLQDALAAGGDQIRVAQGNYKPDQNENGNVTPGDRSATFQLQSGVIIEGGYRGLTGNGSPDDRNIDAFVSTLDGDLLGDDVGNLSGFLACTSGNGNPINPGCEAFDLDGDGDVDDQDGHIDDNAYHVTVGTGASETAIIDGFTITAGNASAFLQDDSGGGLSNDPGSPTVTRCTFLRNSALIRGGGMFNSSDTSNPAVSRCRFVENHVGGTGQGRGGGMANIFGASPALNDCSFIGNTTGFNDGAGMANEFGASPALTNCQFTGNVARGSGGGLFSYSHSNPTLLNCTFSRNIARNGGGMINSGGITPTVANCTFSSNSASDGGGGMINTSASVPELANCIFWNNTDGAGADESAQIQFLSSPPPIVNFSFVQGLTGVLGGVGNIGAASTDQLLVDPENDDLRLVAGSLAIDAGDNSAVPGNVTTDLDGNARFVDDPNVPDSGNGTAPIVDMGAYEFQVVGVPIPTLSEWGMVVMAMLLLTAGTLIRWSPRVNGVN